MRWEWDENSHGGAERGGRAGLWCRVYPQQTPEEGNKHPHKHTHSPRVNRDPQRVFDFHRENWSIWSSGEDGRPSKWELIHILPFLCVCVSIYVKYICYIYIIWTSILLMQRYFTHGASKHPWMWIARKGERERETMKTTTTACCAFNFTSTREFVYCCLLDHTASDRIAFASFCCISLCLPSYFFSTVSFHQVVLLFFVRYVLSRLRVDSNKPKDICMLYF